MHEKADEQNKFQIKNRYKLIRPKIIEQPSIHILRTLYQSYHQAMEVHSNV